MPVAVRPTLMIKFPSRGRWRVWIWRCCSRRVTAARRGSTSVARADVTSDRPGRCISRAAVMPRRPVRCWTAGCRLRWTRWFRRRLSMWGSSRDRLSVVWPVVAGEEDDIERQGDHDCVRASSLGHIAHDADDPCWWYAGADRRDSCGRPRQPARVLRVRAGEAHQGGSVVAGPGRWQGREDGVHAVVPICRLIVRIVSCSCVVIFREVLRSQDAMLDRLGKPRTDMSHDQLVRTFDAQVKKAEAWLAAQPSFEVLYINYNELVDNPAPAVEALHHVPGKLDGYRCDASGD